MGFVFCEDIWRVILHHATQDSPIDAMALLLALGRRFRQHAVHAGRIADHDLARIGKLGRADQWAWLRDRRVSFAPRAQFYCERGARTHRSLIVVAGRSITGKSSIVRHLQTALHPIFSNGTIDVAAINMDLAIVDGADTFSAKYLTLSSATIATTILTVQCNVPLEHVDMLILPRRLTRQEAEDFALFYGFDEPSISTCWESLPDFTALVLSKSAAPWRLDFSDSVFSS